MQKATPTLTFPMAACLPEDPPCGALGLTCREQCWRSQEDQRCTSPGRSAPRKRALPTAALQHLGRSPRPLTLTDPPCGSGSTRALGRMAQPLTPPHGEEEELSGLHLQTARGGRFGLMLRGSSRTVSRTRADGSSHLLNLNIWPTRKQVPNGFHRHPP